MKTEEKQKIIDDQLFIETYLQGYYQDDRIAEIDDLDCVLNNECDEDKRKRLEDAGYFDMTLNQLQKLRTRLIREVMREALEDYLNVTYPLPR